MSSKINKDFIKTKKIVNRQTIYYLTSELSEIYYNDYYGFQDVIKIEIGNPEKHIFLDLTNLNISEFDKSSIVLRNVYGYISPTGEQVINS